MEKIRKPLRCRAVDAAVAVALAVCSLALISFALPLTVSGAENPDAARLKGAWTPVKAELAGQPFPEAVLKTISLRLHGGEYEVSVAGKPDKGTFQIDPSAKPKGMTIVGTEGPNKGRTIPAIYQVQGDTLLICYDLSGKDRPTEFKTEAGSKLYFVTYQKAK
jgi:uncharacterized protein (TIGR03067 family)